MIKELIDLLVPNILLITLGVIILFSAISAKIVSGTLKNIFVLNYKFDWGRLIGGIIKGLAFCVAVIFLVVVAAWSPKFLELGRLLPASTTEVASVIAITSIIAAATYKYFRSALDNLMLFLGITKAELDGYAENTTSVAKIDTPVESVEPATTEILG